MYRLCLNGRTQISFCQLEPPKRNEYFPTFLPRYFSHLAERAIFPVIFYADLCKTRRTNSIACTLQRISMLQQEISRFKSRVSPLCIHQTRNSPCIPDSGSRNRDSFPNINLVVHLVSKRGEKGKIERERGGGKKNVENFTLTSSQTSCLLNPGRRFMIFSSAAFRTPSWVNSTFGFP